MNTRRWGRVAVLSALAACWSVGTLVPRVRSSSSKQIRLRGDIDWAEGSQAAEDTMPQFHVYYFLEGHTTSDANGIYRFNITDKQRLTGLSLIFCKRFEPQFERAQTLAGMKLLKDNKCKWYDLTREYDEKEKRNYWSWELRAGDNKPKDGDMLPDNALIISMSSSRVVRLVDDHPAKQISGEIVLPRVLIEPGSKSKRAAVKSDIEWITSRKINADLVPEKRQKDGVTLALSYY